MTMRHSGHDYQLDTGRAEARTKIVMVLTGLMMVAEIAAGSIFHSMALLADGWHMGTHMTAFLIAVIAYAMARRHRGNPRFSFGTGKIGVLGGFTSSILLLVVAAFMVFESADRLLNPDAIRFGDALVVAVIGLAVNLVSAFLLKDTSDHGHSHAHGHGHGHGHGGEHARDKNLKAAYLHVVADAFTSVTAIAALLIGYFFGIVWIDAVMGFLGSLVIVWWAAGMIRDTVLVLVDYFPASSDLEEEIRGAFAGLADTAINDLHIWQVASGRFAAIISLETNHPLPLSEYHRLVEMHEELVHVSIQVMDAPERRE
jgi:cation diffusion facilitator family transporter